MPYRYEIFLSYPRLPMVEDWLDRFFEPILSQWLHQELVERQYVFPKGQLQLFRDKTTIGVGERWPQSLREGARDSRCTVAILLPSYFVSDYCRAELETFQIRGKEFK